MKQEDLDRIYQSILGESPSSSPDLRRTVRDERSQREFIAKSIAMMAEHTDPIVLISMLIVGTAWLADEHNVNRPHLAKLLLEAQQRHATEIVVGR